MKKILATVFVLHFGLFSPVALAAPGEWWEITSKMEMPGMPFAMPATTQKVCIGKGEESDPRKTTTDKDCQISDVKISGNKSSWKMRCNHDGEVMTGIGEITSTPDSYQGKMQISGTSDGKPMNMTTTYRGKRIGPACDTSQPSPEMAAAQKQMDKACDTSGRSTQELIGMADMFIGKKPMCPGKEKMLCATVRSDASKDADTYSALVMHDRNLQPGSVAVAKACGLNMSATTRSICQTLNGKNYQKLAAHCPAEAKSYRAAMRKKECEGRSFTSRENLSRCLNAEDGGDVRDSEPSDKSASEKPASGSNNPAGAVIDGAKKLKGLFGF